MSSNLTDQHQPYPFPSVEAFDAFVSKAHTALNPGAKLQGDYLTLAMIPTSRVTRGGLEMPENAVSPFRSEGVIIDAGPNADPAVIGLAAVFHTHQCLPRHVKDAGVLLSTVRASDLIETFLPYPTA